MLNPNAQRIYPQNAPRGGAFALTGAGSANDILTFPVPVTPVVQNDTAATIYVASGGDTASAATQGDEAIPAGTEWTSQTVSTWIAVYGVAATKVNGTSAAQIVVYGVE